MKESTRKILLILYPSSQALQTKLEEKVLLNLKQLRFLVPDLTQAGFQSLLFYLEKRGYLFKQIVNEEATYSLTNYGQEQLERQFPALSITKSNWRGQWTMILFLEAIRTDQNFRYLRSLLLKNNCLALNRGVFLYPGQLSQIVLAELKGRYRQAVMVYQLGECLVGDEQITIGQKIALSDSLKVYSGISKEVKQLIEIIGTIKKLNNQQKLDFYSIYNRFVAFLAEDSGIVQHYFPQVEGPLELLSKLQKIVKI